MVRVLVVDDNELCARALAATARAAGFSVVGEASSGEEACDLVARLDPDLVVLDVRMPGMGGIAAADEIAGVSPGTVVLLVSATEASAPNVLRKDALSPSRLRQLWLAHSVGAGATG